jgi:hypothetical protein
MGGPGSGRKKGSKNKNGNMPTKKIKKIRTGLYEMNGHSIENVSRKMGFGFNGWLVSKNNNPRDASVYKTKAQALKVLGL